MNSEVENNKIREEKAAKSNQVLLDRYEVQIRDQNNSIDNYKSEINEHVKKLKDVELKTKEQNETIVEQDKQVKFWMLL